MAPEALKEILIILKVQIVFQHRFIAHCNDWNHTSITYVLMKFGFIGLLCVVDVSVNGLNTCNTSADVIVGILAQYGFSKKMLS